MVLHVVGHEGGDEVVAVVVARLHAHVDRVAGLGRGGLEVGGQQLVGQEVVGRALVDQDDRLGGGIEGGDQLRGVVGLAGLHGTEVTLRET